MAITWKTATLLPVPGEDAIKVNYFDCGPPTGAKQGATYTTVIAIHGLASNGRVWEHAAPLFAQSYRFMAYNRRGYEGTSEHYEGEVKDAVGRYMMDLVGFIRYVVEVLGVPPRDGKGSGGIIVLGWSKGTATPIGLLSLLASPATPPFPLPAALDLTPYLSILSTQVRHIILFDPVGESVGLPDLPETVALLRHPTKPFFQVFGEWLVGTVPEEKRYLLAASADARNAPQDLKVWLAPREDSRECARVAELGLTNIPKDVGVGLLHCTGTISWVLAATTRITSLLRGQHRAVVRSIPGGHHFFAVTDPEIFVPAVKSMIEELDERVES